MSAPASQPVIGVTPGDPAGIGPEIVEQALASGRLPAGIAYRIISSPEEAVHGKPTLATARSAISALEQSVALARSGEIQAIVAGPVHKHQLYQAGFQFPGQTEFFANRFGTTNFAMMLTGGSLAVALVTVHVPLREVVALLSVGEIARVGSLFARYLIERHGPGVRIAVAGLNPHAGESGSIGREEIEIIEPAIELLQGEWSGQAEIEGPVSPDTVFNRAVAGEFQGVLCMYHDQGLIPLKLHAFDQGVNMTLGLPVIRTSPDHGTAFGIAGRGIARPDSMIAAISLAAELLKKRASS